MPGTTFIYISASQFDAVGDVYNTVPQTPMTFTKEYVMLGSPTIPSSSGTGSFTETSFVHPIWTCDAPSAVIGVYERHAVQGSCLGMLVHAIGTTPIGSGLAVLQSTIDHTASTAANPGDFFRSGSLFTGSNTLTQLNVGDQLGWRYQSAIGNLPPNGMVTVVLQRF